jgi:hypothetical protein
MKKQQHDKTSRAQRVRYPAIAHIIKRDERGKDGKYNKVCHALYMARGCGFALVAQPPQQIISQGIAACRAVVLPEGR